MNIIRFKGGLGNQMFQFAFYQSLIAQGHEVKGYLGYYEKGADGNPYVLEKVFPNVIVDQCTEEQYQKYNNRYRRETKTHIGCYLNTHVKPFRSVWMEDEDGVFDSEVYKRKNCVFNGYWQSEKYFQNIETIIREKYTFCVQNPQLLELADKIQKEKRVAVHIRRGDYLSELNVKTLGNICNKEYYSKAMEIMSQKVADPKYAFFSDDMEWVKNELRFEDAIYINKKDFEEYEDWYDMYLMSKCSHNIIANSSFSWWGAWLNHNPDKIVIAPSRWLNDGQTKDIWCKDWIKV